MPSARRILSGVNGMSVSGRGAQRPQRVVDGVHDAARRAGGAGFARALGAELAVGGRRDDVADLDVRHLRRHRHEIVGHVAVEQLAALVIEAVLEQRGADALHHAAAHLLVDQLRIDHGAAVLDAPVLEQLDEAGVGVDLEIARLDAVGEGERPGARHVMARRHQLGLEAGRQGVGAEVGDARDLIEADALGAGGGVDHDAVADVERLGLGLQDRAGDRQHVGAQRLAGLPRRFAADAGRARRPGAAAVGRVVGVAHDDAHACRSARRSAVATHCAITASAPWPCSVTPVWQKIAPVRVEPHGRAVLRRDARAADAVERRATDWSPR